MDIQSNFDEIKFIYAIFITGQHVPNTRGGLRVGDLANKNNVLSLWPFFGAVIYIN